MATSESLAPQTPTHHRTPGSLPCEADQSGGRRCQFTDGPVVSCEHRGGVDTGVGLYAGRCLRGIIVV
jgi:hypothetical protein